MVLLNYPDFVRTFEFLNILLMLPLGLYFHPFLSFEEKKEGEKMAK